MIGSSGTFSLSTAAGKLKTMGDGFLATFQSPPAPFAVLAPSARLSEMLGYPFRAGIHTGEIDLVDDDIAGIAVSIARGSPR